MEGNESLIVNFCALSFALFLSPKKLQYWKLLFSRIEAKVLLDGLSSCNQTIVTVMRKHTLSFEK